MSSGHSWEVHFLGKDVPMYVVPHADLGRVIPSFDAAVTAPDQPALKAHGLRSVGCTADRSGVVWRVYFRAGSCQCSPANEINPYLVWHDERFATPGVVARLVTQQGRQALKRCGRQRRKPSSATFRTQSMCRNDLHSDDTAGRTASACSPLRTRAILTEQDVTIPCIAPVLGLRPIPVAVDRSHKGPQ